MRNVIAIQIYSQLYLHKLTLAYSLCSFDRNSTDAKKVEALSTHRNLNNSNIENRFTKFYSSPKYCEIFYLPRATLITTHIYSNIENK